MKASELRIGNWIIDLHSDNFVQVQNILSTEVQDGISYDINAQWYDHCSFIGEDEKFFKEIELTSLILEVIGFNKSEKSNEFLEFWRLSNGWQIVKCLTTEPSLGIKKNKVYWGEQFWEVKSVHHLQNLYHSLTGQELKIEL